MNKLRAAHPNAWLLWVYGMLGTDMEEPLQKAISAYREATGDGRISYCRLPDTTPDAFGARWHPGHLSHERAAETIAAKIRELAIG